MIEKSRFKNIVSLLILTAGVLAASSNAWGAEDVAACHPGQDPQPAGSDWSGGLHGSPHGLTPTALPGATTVSVAEAKCLVELLDKTLVVVSVVGGDEQLPGFINGLDSEIYTGAEGADSDAKAKSLLNEVTGGDINRPLLFYCASLNCYMSYNAAIRAARLGYRRIYWMRAGIEAWVEAGYPIDLMNMYWGIAEDSGIGAQIDEQTTLALTEIEDELIRFRGSGPLTETEAKRLRPIFEDAFGAMNEFGKFEGSATLKHRIMERFVRAEAPYFTQDDLRSLRESWRKYGGETFFRARYKGPVDETSLWQQAEQAAMVMYSSPVTPANSDVFPDPYIDETTQLAINLLCNEGTCESVMLHIKDKFMPHIEAEMKKRFGTRVAIAADIPIDNRDEMERVIAEISNRLFRKTMVVMATPLAEAFSKNSLAEMGASYPTQAEKKLAKIRSSAEGMERMAWIRSEIVAARQRVVTRFLAGGDK